MVGALLVCSTLIGQAAGSALDREAVLKEYQTVKAAAGRTADAQIEAALWCEAHGLTAERVAHLSRAVLIDPADARARGLLGQVSYNGGWMRPEQVRKAIENDPEIQAAMEEYNHRRARAADTADAQQKLAQWCDQHGLKDQAKAHYQAVLRRDPGRDAVWAKLGYKKHDGRWSRPEDRAAEKAEAEAQKQADKHWKPLLEKYRDRLSDRDEAKRREAEAALAAIADPRAVPMVWTVFVRNDARLQQRAAQTLAQLDGPSASKALAFLAVYSDFPEVRGRAADFLALRDPHDYLASLIDLIHKPFKYKVVRVGNDGSPGRVFVEGEQYNVQRDYRVGAIDWARLPARIFSSEIPLGGGVGPAFSLAMSQNLGLSSSMTRVIHGGTNTWSFNKAAILRDGTIIAAIVEQRRAWQEAKQREQDDIDSIEGVNQEIRAINERVLPLVKTATRQDFEYDQDAWRGWWTNELGYAFQSSMPTVKPVYTEVLAFAPTQPIPHHTCFAAGTPVRTIAGTRPIESLQVGDRVLSQDADTGALSYQPVLVVHHNEPAPLLKLSMGSESVLATGIHRFWKVGKGWTMARDLKPGDLVRTLGGSAVLNSTEPAGTAPVFNLDVAANRDYFVGEAGMLVYDFSVVQPVARPFDAAASR